MVATGAICPALLPRHKRTPAACPWAPSRGVSGLARRGSGGGKHLPARGRDERGQSRSRLSQVEWWTIPLPVPHLRCCPSHIAPSDDRPSYLHDPHNPSAPRGNLPSSTPSSPQGGEGGNLPAARVFQRDAGVSAVASAEKPGVGYR